jgi:hypothetical protein
MTARRVCGILAAVTMLAACAPSAAETTRPAADVTGSAAAEWYSRVLLNQPPAAPAVNPFDVMAGRVTPGRGPTH